MIHLATSDLLRFLASYGVFAVLLFVAIESIGIPFPSETMLLVAAIFAGTTHRLSMPLVILAAESFAIPGDNLGFWVGREGGYRRLAPLRSLHPSGRTPAQTGVVFFGRFVAVLRAWAAFLAGTNRMRWPRFQLFNATGGIVWATLYGLGGYFLGDNIHQLTGPIGPITLVLAVLLMLAGIVIMRSHEQRLAPSAVWFVAMRSAQPAGLPATCLPLCTSRGEQPPAEGVGVVFVSPSPKKDVDPSHDE